jgi:hypothetical protein
VPCRCPVGGIPPSLLSFATAGYTSSVAHCSSLIIARLASENHGRESDGGLEQYRSIKIDYLYQCTRAYVSGLLAARGGVRHIQGYVWQAKIFYLPTNF